MPVGVYFRTEATRKAIALGAMGNHAHLGHKHSEETRAKMSKNHKGTLGMRFPDRVSGPDHPLWRGGVSGYNSDFSLKAEQARARDNYRCRLCFIEEGTYPRQLDVHHIDYDSKNDNLLNLISLCRSCHMRAQIDQEYWQAVFKIMLEWGK